MKISGVSIISFEGIDCAGKMTLSSVFIKELKKVTDRPVFYISFPTKGTTSGDFVETFLAGELFKNRKLCPEFNTLPFIFDRSSFRLFFRRVSLRNGIVVCDRYSLSNIAYGLANCMKEKNFDLEKQGIQWAEKIFNIEHYFCGVPPADLNVFLDTDFSLIKERLAAKRKMYHSLNKRDIYEESILYQRYVLVSYKLLINSSFQKWIVLDSDFLKTKGKKFNFEQIFRVFL